MHYVREKNPSDMDKMGVVLTRRKSACRDMHGVPQGDVMQQPVPSVACFCPLSEPWRKQIQGLDFAPF
jgi:hypothetical protein